jgi:tetratricopeptide (TPR) repeat protein
MNSAVLTMPGRVPEGLPGAPVPLARHFTGRPDTLGSLSGMLVPGSAVALVPDQGTGAAPWEWRGSHGKTHAAAHAAMGLRRSGSVDLVAWVDASGRASLLDGLASAARSAGLDAAGGAEAAAAGLVAWLGATRQRWLVVLDDLRDPAHAGGLWPAGPAGITLITARDPALVAGSSARLVPVPCYSQREAVAALLGWLSPDPDHRAGQLDLALALGCEPAAIAHAGAVISTAELTCREYHGRFLRRRAAIEAGLGREVPAAVVTWVMSAEHAEILEPGAGTWPLLVMASLLSPHGIPLAVLTSRGACRYLAGSDTPGTAPPERATAAVMALRAAGLLAIDGNGPLPVARISVPLQAAVRAAAQRELLDHAMAATADALAECQPEDPRSAAAMLLRSCAAALRSAAGDALLAGGRHHRVLVAAGQSHDAAGLAGPAAAWWRQLASVSARVLGDDHAETLTAASLAASALLAAGQPEDALSWASWVMTRREATLGPDHPGTIKAATVLGRALAGAGRSVDAIAMLHDTAARGARALGPAHAATIAARHEHAEACLAAGRPGDAVSSLRQLVTALTESLGPDDTSTLAAAGRLAAACLAAGRTSEAIDGYGEIVSCRDRLLGADHPDSLRVRALLASAHGAAGDMSAALRHYQQAHAGYRRALGEAHRGTLACAADLARAYMDCGQVTAAMSVLADAISEAGRLLPPGDPLTRELEQARAGLLG